MSLRDEITTILNNEGAASEGGWHSWRCFDKGRYPEPCHCTEVVAEMVVAAVLDAAREAVAALRPKQDGWHPDGDAVLRLALAAIDALKKNNET